jgi:putative DNA primase/helicase
MDEISTARLAAGSHNKSHDHFTTNIEVIEAFKSAMFDTGIQPPDTLIGDGSLHRFKIDGKLNGAYILHLDGRAAGYFEDFKQGVKHRWKMAGDFKRLTDAERQAFKVLALKAEHDRKIEEAAKHNQAAIKAGFIWRNAAEAGTNHQYLIKKHTKPHELRLYKGSLVVPIYSPEGQLVNLQFIDPEGKKMFLGGGQKKGCFSFIGSPTDRVLVCEGWATGASLYEHTGKFTIVALDAGNLKPVAIEIRMLSPKAEIIICADKDESGVGEQKARQAALAIGCSYIAPPVIGDFNDYLTGGV